MIKNKILIAFIFILSGTGASANGLDKILQKGFMEVAVYDSFPPFSYKDEDGRTKGIDVDIAKEIAKELGVQVGFRLFLADESTGDDLRNMVWKGHYLAGGPADLMMHVPYDPNFATQNEQVSFLRPYYKELVAFAINTTRIRNAKTLTAFIDEPIGVETATLSDAYLLGAYNGRLRESVKHYKTVDAAVISMVNNEISAVMANRGELEHSLSKHKHDFVVTKLQTPGLSLEGWELGTAVSHKHADLAKKVDEIIAGLKSSGKIEEIFNAHGISYFPAESDKLL